MPSVTKRAGSSRVLFIVLLASGLTSATAEAACNLIEVTQSLFPSTQGGVKSPITAPGKTVELTALADCSGSAGFEPVATSNTVTVTFDPPGSGSNTDVVVDSLSYAVGDCTLPGGRCRTLEFVMPSTVATLPPYGLAGPASIVVRDGSTVVVAEIGPLFQPTFGCDKSPETVFQTFTVLPVANNFADLESGATTEFAATIDGGGNLLVPFDYWGSGIDSVLAETPGSPVAIFLEGSADIPAQGATDPQTILEVVAGQSDPSRFVRSFTLDGRPLPPLLRVKSDGGLFGTADAVESVIRIARNDSAGGPDLFDVTDRLFSDRGPVIISSFNVVRNDPVPLESIQASTETVAFVRDESREGVDLNGDLDMTDLVVQVLDAETGAVTNTGKAVTQVPSGFFAAPALVTSGEFAAFLESEVGQGDTDLNLDGDTYDNILRVFDRTGAELTSDPGLDAAFSPVVDGRSLGISDAVVFAQIPGMFRGLVRDGIDGVDGLSTPRAVSISPDGSHVYVASLGPDNAVSTFSRDPLTGALNFVEAVFDGVDGVDGLGGAIALAVSPDGKHVYVAGGGDDAVAAFDRDASTGELSFIEAKFDDVDGVIGLDNALAVSLSPDGAHLYALGAIDRAIVAFSRDQTTGALTFVEAEVDGVDGVDGLFFAQSLAISPDGAHVYVISGIDDAVATFSRNLGSGALTFLEAQFFGIDVVELVDPSHIAISPDGAHAYITGNGDRAIARFSRDSATGLLTYEQAHHVGVEGSDGLFASDVTMSPDGARVFVTGLSDHAFAIFERAQSTGALTLVTIERDGLGGVDGIAGAHAVSVSPDGAHAYVPGDLDDAVAVFTTHSFATAFDVPGSDFLTPRPASNLMAVGANRAIVLTPESADAVDLNDDLDASDQVAQLYDASASPTNVTDLRRAASRAAISDALVALTVPEGEQGSSDRNGDGDMRDDVLATFEMGSGAAPKNTGLSADAIGVLGTQVVFITNESDENDTDLNEDGDSLDRVVRIYDNNKRKVTELRQAAEEFVIGGTLVAFRTSEADQNNTDLNGDLDTADAVMQIYNLESNRLINTRRAAIPCSIPGCDPTIPYKINGNTVSFLTDESEQSEDLNGDGDSDDIVLTVFSVTSGAGQLIDTIEDDTGTPTPPQLDLSPFPEDTGRGTITLVEVAETDVGRDINEDGSIDADDIVVLLAGDADDDGTIDDFDTCVEGSNADQVDGDGDGLGDSACDPEPSACGPTPLAGCLQPGIAQLGLTDSSDDEKDKLKWKWVKGDATAVDDFGDPVSELPHYSVCIYDSSATEQPVLTGAVLPGGTCGKKPCWKQAGKTGYKHKDKAGEPSGVSGAKLKAGALGKSQISLKGRGVNVEMPSLPLQLPVVVQFVATKPEGPICWEANYAVAKTNDDRRFNAKTP